MTEPPICRFAKKSRQPGLLAASQHEGHSGKEEPPRQAGLKSVYETAVWWRFRHTGWDAKLDLG